jgi:hypothetical protein
VARAIPLGLLIPSIVLKVSGGHRIRPTAVLIPIATGRLFVGHAVNDLEQENAVFPAATLVVDLAEREDSRLFLDASDDVITMGILTNLFVPMGHYDNTEASPKGRSVRELSWSELDGLCGMVKCGTSFFVRCNYFPGGIARG